MNVDIENFTGASALFNQNLAKASFAAVDLEMTGIFSYDEAQRISNGDTPATRYAKQRKVVKSFGVVQVGICLFEEAEDDKIIARPFNFYVFPRPIDVSTSKGNVKETEVFSVDSSSIDFLRQNDMDFGRWITKGLGYVNKNVETKLRRVYGLELENEGGKVNEKVEQRKPVELTKPMDVEWLKKTMESIENFATDGKTKEMKLPKVNPFLILALRLAIAEKYPTMEIEKRQVGSRAWEFERWLLNYTGEEKEERTIKLKETYEKDLTKHLGFREIWKALGQSKIPVATHNGFLDLLFISQAVGFDLPETLFTFKNELRQEFLGSWYDTKLLADTNRDVINSHSTALGDLYEALQKREDKPVITCPAPFDGYAGPDAKYHEAAYDALCTGVLFAHFKKRDVIKDHENRIFMMRSLFALNVKEAVDPILRPDSIIRHVYDFDKSFRNDDFLEMLKPIVEKVTREKVNLSWIDDKSLLLLVPKEVEDELDTILKERSTVLKYGPYQVIDEEILEAPLKKRRIEAPISTSRKASDITWNEL